MSVIKRVTIIIVLCMMIALAFACWKTIFHDFDQRERDHEQSLPTPTIIHPGELLVQKDAKNTVFHQEDPFHLCVRFVQPHHYINGTIPVTSEGYELKPLPPEESGWMVMNPIRAY